MRLRAQAAQLPSGVISTGSSARSGLPPSPLPVAVRLLRPGRAAQPRLVGGRSLLELALGEGSASITPRLELPWSFFAVRPRPAVRNLSRGRRDRSLCTSAPSPSPPALPSQAGGEGGCKAGGGGGAARQPPPQGGASRAGLSSDRRAERAAHVHVPTAPYARATCTRDPGWARARAHA